MKTLLISPDGSTVYTTDSNENLIDITTDLKDEVFFYKTIVTLTGELEPITHRDQEVEDIFYHIVEKAYLSGEKKALNHRLNNFNYTNQFTDNIKTKLLIAFTNVFLEACRKKLNTKVEVEYL